MDDYVKLFRETSPYINMHRGKTFVIAVSGDALLHGHFPHIIQDIALLNSLGIRIVLVQGARPQIDERLAAANIPARFNGHTRITDEPTLACVKEAVGAARIAVESLLSMGLANSPMDGARIRVISGNFITAKPLGVREGVDFHHTGEVRRIDRAGVQRQLDEGAIVLLPCLGYSPTGEAFNLQFEEVATQVAIGLQAEKLIIFCEEDGITNTAGELQRTLSLPDIPAWLDQLQDRPAQQRALQSGYLACRQGVPRSHLISYRQEGALLRELFTREGTGTLLLQDGAEITRLATIDDIAGLLELIAPLEEKGVLVKRSRELLETEISRFTLLVHPEGLIVACAALYPFPGHQSAELACVATHPDYHNQGLASRLFSHIEKQARAMQLTRLFVLTTQTAHWFLEKGFQPATLDDLPAEKKQLYNYQRNAKIFVKRL